MRINGLKVFGVFCVLALAGCAMEMATEADEAVASEELVRVVRVINPPASPTRLTLFSEAGYWGTSLDVSLTPNGTQETIRLINTPQVESAGLLGAISSLRLTCGSRAAHVVLFRAYNGTASLNGWSESDIGHTVYCLPGQTVEVNLHTQAPSFADRVGSVYFAQHAREVSELQLSWLLTSVWNTALQNVSSDARVDGAPRLRMIGDRSFELRQDFVIVGETRRPWVDSFWCASRHGHFVIRAQLVGNTWTSSFVSRYVDTGGGDSYGCRSGMENAMESAARAAGQRLAHGLNTQLMPLAGDHPRHYLVPTDRLRAFVLSSGGAAATSPILAPISGAAGI